MKVNEALLHIVRRMDEEEEIWITENLPIHTLVTRYNYLFNYRLFKLVKEEDYLATGINEDESETYVFDLFALTSDTLIKLAGLI